MQNLIDWQDGKINRSPKDAERDGHDALFSAIEL